MCAVSRGIKKGERVIQGNCLEYLQGYGKADIALSFLDPPFNQGKEYRCFDDKQSDEVYWGWMEDILKELHKATLDGGALYFMHREKNTEQVLRCIRRARWHFKNLIIWKKMTSAVPSSLMHGKHYQIIVFATKGSKTRLFNKLRITPPLPVNYKYEREGGVFVTDVWDDIREMTSGYFAGDEALRNEDGERFHKQQSPLALLTRIILSSSMPDDLVFDPFGGTGTTSIVATQLARQFKTVEIDSKNISCIKKRLKKLRTADNILKYKKNYHFTDDLEKIWSGQTKTSQKILTLLLPLHNEKLKAQATQEVQKIFKKRHLSH